MPKAMGLPRLAADTAASIGGTNQDVKQIYDTLRQVVAVLKSTQAPGQEWVFDTFFQEFILRSMRPVKTVTMRGMATCGWCHNIHSIEEIKACRRKANSIDPQVWQAAKTAALRSASKLKELKE